MTSRSALGPAFAGLTLALALALATACTDSETVLDPEDGGAGGAGGDGAPSTSTTVDATTGNGGGAPGCTSNAQCIEDNGQLPYVCRAGGCRSVLSEDCTTFVGDPDALADDQTRIIGVLAPLTGPLANLGSSQSNVVGLALSELRETLVGLPAEDGRTAVVGVVCDESVDAVRAATHLVDDLGATSMIGPSEAGNAVAVATSKTIAAGAMMLTLGADDPDLRKLDDSGLVWQMGPSVAAAGPAIAAAYARVEPSLGAGPRRVAILGTGDPRSEAVAESLLATLFVNGKSASDSLAEGTIIRVVADADADPTSAIASLVDFDAHAIIVTSPALLGSFIPRVELEADAPVWIAGPLPRDAEQAIADPDLAGRAIGVRAGLPGDRQRFSELSIRYASEYGAELPEDAALGYDAVYLLIDAMVAAGEAPPTGAAIAGAMGLLVPPGIETAVGPSSLAQAFSALQAGNAIDLDGASGSLDFDTVAGEAPRAQQVLCNDGSGAIPPSGLVFEPASGLQGTTTCF